MGLRGVGLRDKETKGHRDVRGREQRVQRPAGGHRSAFSAPRAVDRDRPFAIDDDVLESGDGCVGAAGSRDGLEDFLQQGDRFVPANGHSPGENVADADGPAPYAARLGREVVEAYRCSPSTPDDCLARARQFVP